MVVRVLRPNLQMGGATLEKCATGTPVSSSTFVPPRPASPHLPECTVHFWTVQHYRTPPGSYHFPSGPFFEQFCLGPSVPKATLVELWSKISIKLIDRTFSEKKVLRIMIPKTLAALDKYTPEAFLALKAALKGHPDWECSKIDETTDVWIVVMIRNRIEARQTHMQVAFAGPYYMIADLDAPMSAEVVGYAPNEAQPRKMRKKVTRTGPLLGIVPGLPENMLEVQEDDAEK